MKEDDRLCYKNQEIYRMLHNIKRCNLFSYKATKQAFKQKSKAINKNGAAVKPM